VYLAACIAYKHLVKAAVAAGGAAAAGPVSLTLLQVRFAEVSSWGGGQKKSYRHHVENTSGAPGAMQGYHQPP
jgi:hypothetical protein